MSQEQQYTRALILECSIDDLLSFQKRNRNKSEYAHVELDLVDTDSRSPLLLTWHRLGAPPCCHIPLPVNFLWQGRGLLTNLQRCYGPQKFIWCCLTVD